MSKIAIFGDTSQDLNLQMAEEYGVECLSYQVQMDENHYKDQVDIDTETFFKKLPEHQVLKTGIPSPFCVLQKLEHMKKEGYTDVIMISSSEKLTGMYALYASYGNNFEGMKLHLVDSEKIASGAGVLVLYASKLREKGLSAEEIVGELNQKKQNITVYALFRTLSYLVKGGRFNKYKGLLGNLLNIMPLLMIREGSLELKDKFRGRSKSFEALKKVALEDLSKYKKYWIVIFSGDNDEEAILLKEALKDRIEEADLFIETRLSPVLGVHSGPKAVGITVMGLE